jgi:predicted nucleic acid-binding Zn ribbon protein
MCPLFCRTAIIWGGYSEWYLNGIKNVNVFDWDTNQFIRKELSRSGVAEQGSGTAVISSKYFNPTCEPSCFIKGKHYPDAANQHHTDVNSITGIKALSNRGTRFRGTGFRGTGFRGTGFRGTGF